MKVMKLQLTDQIQNFFRNYFINLVPKIMRILQNKCKATVECGFTLKRVRDMTRTYSQMHRTDKYSEHSSIIWPVWPNG